jgi:hypothetical protein
MRPNGGANALLTHKIAILQGQLAELHNLFGHSKQPGHADAIESLFQLKVEPIVKGELGDHSELLIDDADANVRLADGHTLLFGEACDAFRLAEAVVRVPSRKGSEVQAQAADGALGEARRCLPRACCHGFR